MNNNEINIGIWVVASSKLGIFTHVIKCQIGATYAILAHEL